jgi:hypothetical protein
LKTGIGAEHRKLAERRKQKSKFKGAEAAEACEMGPGRCLLCEKGSHGGSAQWLGGDKLDFVGRAVFRNL